jgi:hypothetical protein
VQLQVSYLLVPWACARGGQVVLHAVALGTLAVAAAGLVLASRASAAARRAAVGGPVTGFEARRFVAGCGVGLSLLFLLVIVASAIPNFILQACD